MATFKAKFYLVVLLQMLMLTSMIVYKQVILITGHRILLKAAPVDPQDLFRGSYVALKYDFSHLEQSRWQGSGTYAQGTEPVKPTLGSTVYVVLSRQGRYWEYDYLSQTPPVSGDVFLRGKVTEFTPAAQNAATVDIDCGIESFFASGKRANELERPRSGQGNVIDVEVRVDRRGSAVIRDVTRE